MVFQNSCVLRKEEGRLHIIRAEIPVSQWRSFGFLMGCPLPLGDWVFLESSACSVCFAQPTMADSSSCECAVDVTATHEVQKGEQ